MRIESFTEAKNMPEKYLPSLVDAEIECWGSKPFGEYKICKNDTCKSIYSIEDVYGSVEEFQKNRENGELISDFCCEECGNETEYVYEKEEFIELAREYVKKEVSLVLLVSKNDIIRGFGVVVRTTVKDLINNELNTRVGSYDKDFLLKLISNKVFYKSDASLDKVIGFHHIFVGSELRNLGYGKAVSNSMIDFIKGNIDNPIFLETKKDCNGYNFSLNMGFEELITDTHGYTLMCTGLQNCSYGKITGNLGLS